MKRGIDLPAVCLQPLLDRLERAEDEAVATPTRRRRRPVCPLGIRAGGSAHPAGLAAGCAPGCARWTGPMASSVNILKACDRRAHFGWSTCDGHAAGCRWPPLLYAQVGKRDRRRRPVGVRHACLRHAQGVSSSGGGTRLADQYAFIERQNLTICSLCRGRPTGDDPRTGEAGLGQPLPRITAPTISVCPMPPYAAVAGARADQRVGSAKQWRPCTPAMAAAHRPRLDFAGGAAVPRASLAAATDVVSGGYAS